MNTHDIFDMHKEKKKASFPNPINVSIKPDANQKLKHQLEGVSNWMDERSEVDREHMNCWGCQCNRAL